MAFVVARRSARFEIRESVHTPAGPRSRTLATFRTLSDEVLDRARRAATRPFDAHHVRHAARRAGAPVDEPAPDRAARSLLAEAAAGRLPRPALGRLVVDLLLDTDRLPELEADGGMAQWAGASPQERGDALRDLLDMTDRIPRPRRGPLRFPRLASTRG